MRLRISEILIKVEPQIAICMQVARKWEGRLCAHVKFKA